jgi:hypothetical protein
MTFQKARSVPGSKYNLNPWYVAPKSAATAEVMKPAHHNQADTWFRGPIILERKKAKARLEAPSAASVSMVTGSVMCIIHTAAPQLLSPNFEEE